LAAQANETIAERSPASREGHPVPQQFTVAASTHGQSPVLLTVFALGGVVALGAGLSWALDLRGVAVRRSQPAGHLRLLGALLAFTGVVLLVIAYALWQLG
jgi:hypothetical protein